MFVVTGGAGFIGANFILNWLAAGGEPVINLDKMTYAGNLPNLSVLQGDARYMFVPGDIGDGFCAGQSQYVYSRRIARVALSDSVPKG